MCVCFCAYIDHSVSKRNEAPNINNRSWLWLVARSYLSVVFHSQKNRRSEQQEQKNTNHQGKFAKKAVSPVIKELKTSYEFATS